MAKQLVGRIPPAHWSEADQMVWENSSAVQAWSGHYAHRVARGYSRLLAYAGKRAVSRETVEAFDKAVAQEYPSVTAATYLLDLWYALAILRPEDDWAWLRQHCRDLRPKKSQPKGATRIRIPPLQVPFDRWSGDQQTRWNAAFIRGSRRERYPTRKERKAKASECQAADETNRFLPLLPYRWTAAYRRRVERGWGMWLGWARANGGDEWPTPEAVSRFVGACEARRASTVTMASYVWEIRRAAETMWPTADWNWLKDDAYILKLEAEPSRDKWRQFAPIDEICRLGVTLMIEAMEGPATVRNAIKFRDGYAISFIALRPKRSKNVAESRVGEHLVLDADGVPVQLHWPTTKNQDPSTVPYPAALAEFHRMWWSRYRPVLLGSRPDAGHFWIGHSGAPLSAGQIYSRLRLWTKDRLGIEIGTHAFRTDFATTFAAIDARLLPMVQIMLDHRRPTSMKPYQLIGKQFSAARALEELQRPEIENTVARLRRGQPSSRRAAASSYTS